MDNIRVVEGLRVFVPVLRQFSSDELRYQYYELAVGTLTYLSTEDTDLAIVVLDETGQNYRTIWEDIYTDAVDGYKACDKLNEQILAFLEIAHTTILNCGTKGNLFRTGC